MQLFEWNDSFSVGNLLMDAHHRVFFEMIKSFGKYVDKSNHDAIKDRIEFLIEYAVMHLGAEEKLMKQANYPELADHRVEHDAFTRQLLTIQASFIEDPNSVSGDNILKVMQDWLVNHIVCSDKRYMPYLQKFQD
jgi:hemerythrin